MDAIIVKGGHRLSGEVAISGAKNAALPLIASALLCEGGHVYRNVPDLRDIRTMIAVLESMGGVTAHFERHVLNLTIAGLKQPVASYDLVRTMRASVLVLGPLVARYGFARVSLPGGCAIGARPIDQHLKGLIKMGAEVTLDQGYVEVHCKQLRGAEITCDMVTVTGTMNLMMAASLAKGRTIIENAAREPEVEELGQVINKMGGRVVGAGTSVITVEGVEHLHAVEHAIMPDRIETGTFMVAAAATGGDVTLTRCSPEHVEPVTQKLLEAGASVQRTRDGIRVRGSDRVYALEIATQPHPGFPTDMQAQMMVLCALADGQSIVTENIFENRFMHVPELARMNGDIHIDGRTAVIRGPTNFVGTTVMASDLRASAALIIAGLVAQKGSVTRVRRVYHLDRGYERIERKFRKLGADIRRIKEK